jgi:hypothetical protein
MAPGAPGGGRSGGDRRQLGRRRAARAAGLRRSAVASQCQSVQTVTTANNSVEWQCRPGRAPPAAASSKKATQSSSPCQPPHCGETAVRSAHTMPAGPCVSSENTATEGGSWSNCWANSASFSPACSPCSAWCRSPPPPVPAPNSLVHIKIKKRVHHQRLAVVLSAARRSFTTRLR